MKITDRYGLTIEERYELWLKQSWMQKYSHALKTALKTAAFIHAPVLLIFLESLRLACFPEGAQPFLGAGFFANVWRACAVAAAIFFPAVLRDEVLSIKNWYRPREQNKPPRKGFLSTLPALAGFFFFLSPVLLLCASSFFLICLAMDLQPLTSLGLQYGALFAAGIAAGLFFFFFLDSGGKPLKIGIFLLLAFACMAVPPVRMFSAMLLAGIASCIVASVLSFFIMLCIDPGGLAL